MMIQKEYFKTATTRELLSLRRSWSFKFPRFEGDKDLGYDDEIGWLGYHLDEDSLKEELSKRPHVATGKEAKLLRKLKSELKMTESEIREIPKYRKMLSELS